ncbi:MAG: DUF455 domain-containing protein [Planctomyces sp.]|nr:DUF455 domain-containing protein [Planctomyces sp.]
MELRTFAETVLRSPVCMEKLAPLREEFTDREPGVAERWELPAREERLVFGARRAAPAMPPLVRFGEPKQRAIAHHIMANHELQALEVMAWVLLTFPEAPTEFRLGLAHVIQDEQRHTRMHIERGKSLGVEFGSLPVNCHIWRHAMAFTSVLDYLAGLPLTFEGCNLDHSLEFEQAFLAAGDVKSAAIMRRIHEDEIEHVRFGLEWLRKLKPEAMSDWEAYERHLHFPLRPGKSIGHTFDEASRLATGMDAEFIERLKGSAKGFPV